ncbi:hypothetical protein XENOCAPTIV_030933 [Xenoophorus captivus]|uniref:CLEC16A/TT9 C-terminal domain-containing protein n=1 Tax=Xenoophorus captivus TaxID=1517983 RepID=A0ABV0R5R7_9TELE
MAEDHSWTWCTAPLTAQMMTITPCLCSVCFMPSHTAKPGTDCKLLCCASVLNLSNFVIGVNRDLLERLQLPVPDQERGSYSVVLVERLIRIMNQAALPGDTYAYGFKC